MKKVCKEIIIFTKSDNTNKIIVSQDFGGI